MGLSHRERPHWGVQFHPESIWTEHGRRLLENFRDLSRPSRARPRLARPARPERPRRAGRRPPGPLAADRPARRSGDRVRAPLRPAALRLLARQQPRLGRAVALLVHRRERRPARAGSCPTTPPAGACAPATPTSVRTHDESIFSYLERELAGLACAADDVPFDLAGGFVGYFGYEVKADCGSPLRHPSPWPDAQFILSDRLIVFDHLEGHTYAVCLAHDEADARPWLEQTVRELNALAPLPAPAGCGRGARPSSRPRASARDTSTTSPPASARSPPARATRSASPTSCAAAPGSTRCRCTASCAGATRRRAPRTCASAT